MLVNIHVLTSSEVPTKQFDVSLVPRLSRLSFLRDVTEWPQRECACPRSRSRFALAEECLGTRLVWHLFTWILQDLGGNFTMSWNHQEFEVRYECLSEEIKIGDYYLRLLLEDEEENITITNSLVYQLCFNTIGLSFCWWSDVLLYGMFALVKWL